MNLKNKKILITGATGGIGNCLVKKFYNFGATIIATGTNEEKLNNLKNQYQNVHIEKFRLNSKPLLIWNNLAAVSIVYNTAMVATKYCVSSFFSLVH